jgi:hypothetical protein
MGEVFGWRDSVMCSPCYCRVERYDGLAGVPDSMYQNGVS